MKAFAKIRFFLIIPIVCVGFFSCDPNENLPPETVLEFVGVQYFGDTAGNLIDINIQVSFQDGDGNIGYLGVDTVNNLFVHVFDRTSLTELTYEPMQTAHPTEPQDWIIRFAISDLSEGRQQSVRGMLDIGFGGRIGFEFGDASNFRIMQQRSAHGRVRFDIYMLDRDSVQSNIITTPEINIRP